MNNANKSLTTGNVPPANLFNFLRACYGVKAAENIFKSYGLPRPGIGIVSAPHRKNEQVHAVA